MDQDKNRERVIERSEEEEEREREEEEGMCLSPLGTVVRFCLI